MRTLLRLLAVLLFLVPSSFAQEPTTIVGRVTTAEDALSLPGATVEVEALGLSVVTDAEGHFALTLPANMVGKPVVLKVSAPGMRSKTAELTVLTGTMTQDFALGLGFSEEITVGSRAAGAEAEKAVPVDVLTQRQIQTTGASETSAIL
jgi:hypothetical protein